MGVVEVAAGKWLPAITNADRFLNVWGSEADSIALNLCRCRVVDTVCAGNLEALSHAEAVCV